ncbi:MAG: TIGR00266 family protein [Cyanobacteria bacterium SW_9_44_58]|nr:MAG: TIGR00266 family protein [Cyanobacteria bacterium SW_9_44_58]
MEYEIRYKPAFSTIFVALKPGDKITAEAGAMTSMDANLLMKTKFSGGFFSALLKKFLGKESLFVNTYINNSDETLSIVLSQSIVGDIEALALEDSEICLQPGAYIAHTSGIDMGVAFAGFASWIAGEGLFKLKLKGQGTVFFGAYGGLTKKEISGDYVVDNGHLVAYEPNIQMGIRLAGGIFGSLTSGEGLVNKLKGSGTIYLQSRSVNSLVRFLKPKVPK